MSDPIPSSDTLAALRKLADRVTVAADVDDVIREELVGHLEDKLLDYTSGRLRPSEADALLLVERHLGPPGPLSNRLSRVYGRLVPAVPVDRLLTLVTATAASFAAVDLLVAAVGHGLDPAGRAGWHITVAVETFRWAEPVWAALVLARILVRTRDLAWTRSRRHRVALAGTAIAVAMVMPLLEPLPRTYAADWPTWTTALVDTVSQSSRWIGALGLGGLWLWWGTREARRRSSPVVVLIAWSLTMVLAELIRPGWIVDFTAVSHAVWPHELSWRLRGPTLMPGFTYDLPGPGLVLQMASLLYAGRAMWLALRCRWPAHFTPVI